MSAGLEKKESEKEKGGGVDKVSILRPKEPAGRKHGRRERGEERKTENCEPDHGGAFGMKINNISRNEKKNCTVEKGKQQVCIPATLTHGKRGGGETDLKHTAARILTSTTGPQRPRN